MEPNSALVDTARDLPTSSSCPKKPFRPRLRLVARSGIELHQGEPPDLFRAACNMGLEGMVSKRSDRPYLAGRSKDWIKVKNRKHPAMNRVRDAFS